MVYTVTLNPSLDYIVSVEDFQPGMTNRTSTELLLPGGKGINVSTVLKNLGIDSTALGFVAGFTGEELERRLAQARLKTDFIHLEDGFTRINLKLKSTDGTEINGQGPAVSSEKLGLLMEKLESLSEGDVLILSGSIPVSMQDDTYEKILAGLEGKGIRTVVDAAGKLLLQALPYRPFLVKPNNHELGGLFGATIRTREEAVTYARMLREMGAVNVLVSLAGEGAVLVSADGKTYCAAAPVGELKNSVGAGDSMVAGFMAGWLEKGDYEYAFRMGLAAGSASAFSDRFATKEEVLAVYEQMRYL